jgi:hypothetical protein
MKRIQSAKTILLRVAGEQLLRARVILLQQRLHEDPWRLRRVLDIGQEFDRIGRCHRPRPHLYRAHRRELDLCQPRNADLIVLLGENRRHGWRARLRVEEFRQGARIEEVEHLSVLSALLNDQVGERSRHILPTRLDLLNGSPCPACGRDLRGGLQRQRHACLVVYRDRLDRPKNSVVVNGFHANRHRFSLRDSPSVI